MNTNRLLLLHLAICIAAALVRGAWRQVVGRSHRSATTDQR